MWCYVLWGFFLSELIFADQGQSTKFAKIGTCKIFMLHGFELLIEKPRPGDDVVSFLVNRKTEFVFSFKSMKIF